MTHHGELCILQATYRAFEKPVDVNEQGFRNEVKFTEKRLIY